MTQLNELVAKPLSGAQAAPAIDVDVANPYNTTLDEQVREGIERIAAFEEPSGTPGYVVYVTNDTNVQSEIDFCRHIVKPGIVPSSFEAAKHVIHECRFGVLGETIIVEVYPHVGTEFRFKYTTTLVQVER